MRTAIVALFVLIALFMQGANKSAGLLNPVMAQLDPPDGFCAGTTEVLHVNYFANRIGQATSFDAIFTASGGRSGGWIAFEGGNSSTEQYIPAMRPARIYTMTVDFPSGVATAPLLIYTTGDGCILGGYTPRAGPSAMYSVILKELYILVH